MTGVDICEVCTQEVCATPVQLFRRFQLPRAVPRPPGAQTLSHAHQFDQARTFDPQKSFLFQARSVYIQMMISILMNLVCGQCSCFQANTPRGASLPPHIPSAPPSTLYTFCQYFQTCRKTLSMGTACWNLDRKLLSQFECARACLLRI